MVDWLIDWLGCLCLANEASCVRMSLLVYVVTMMKMIRMMIDGSSLKRGIIFEQMRHFYIRYQYLSIPHVMFGAPRELIDPRLESWRHSFLLDPRIESWRHSFLHFISHRRVKQNRGQLFLCFPSYQNLSYLGVLIFGLNLTISLCHVVIPVFCFHISVDLIKILNTDLNGNNNNQKFLLVQFMPKRDNR
jgi:hypothetical protein